MGSPCPPRQVVGVFEHLDDTLRRVEALSGFRGFPPFGFRPMDPRRPSHKQYELEVLQRPDGREHKSDGRAPAAARSAASVPQLAERAWGLLPARAQAMIARATMCDTQLYETFLPAAPRGAATQAVHGTVLGR